MGLDSGQASCVVNLPSGDSTQQGFSQGGRKTGCLFCGQEPRKQQRARGPESSLRGLMVGSNWETSGKVKERGESKIKGTTARKWGWASLRPSGETIGCVSQLST